MSLRRNAARDAEMFELRALGWTYAQIGERYKLTGVGVRAAVKAYAAGLPEETKDDIRETIGEFYRIQLKRLNAIAETGPIPAYSNGRPIVAEWKEDGTPESYAMDYSGVIKATEAAVKVSEAARKLMGLDAPVEAKIEASGKIIHELIGVDVSDV